MPKNLEVKIQLDKFDNILDTLNGLGVKKIKELEQSDVYYENNNMKVKLRIENDEYFLIKYLRDENADNRWSNYELLKLEGDNPRKYLSDLMTEKIVVNKKRKLFIYDNTRIHLDEVENLGKFIELETKVIDSEENAERRFKELVKLLNLNLNKQIRSGYKELIEKL